MTDSVETAVLHWRRSMAAHVGIDEADVEELEDHLRLEISEIERNGIRPAEVVSVAASRIGEGSKIADDMRLVRTESVWVDRIRWALLGYLTFIGLKWLAGAVYATTLAVAGQSHANPWELSGAALFIQAVLLGLAVLGMYRIARHGTGVDWLSRLRAWWSASPWAYPAAAGIMFFLCFWSFGMTVVYIRFFDRHQLGQLASIWGPLALALRFVLPVAALVCVIALDRRQARGRAAGERA